VLLYSENHADDKHNAILDDGPLLIARRIECQAKHAVANCEILTVAMFAVSLQGRSP